jgi:hypothetical protein
MSNAETAAIKLAEHIAELVESGADCPCCGGWMREGKHDDDKDDYVCPVGAYIAVRGRAAP